MDLVRSLFETQPLVLDRHWLAFLAVGTALYLALRIAKKHTRWLQEEGR